MITYQSKSAAFCKNLVSYNDGLKEKGQSRNAVVRMMLLAVRLPVAQRLDHKSGQTSDLKTERWEQFSIIT